ncbi:SIP domain-containing protein [Mesorhizobium sp. NPDC059054]|uniref:SIP domain-containing protein n=1 Tax=Mesorhizobium sp. NPDC059054 TaxID=3346711 RepID=UPI0036A9191F
MAAFASLIVAGLFCPSTAYSTTNKNVTQIELHWLERDGKALGTDERLAEHVLSAQWPKEGTAFGWVCCGGGSRQLVRGTWRDEMGRGRDQTIAAACRRGGQAGLMAG